MELKQEIADLSKIIQDGVTVDHKTKLITPNEGLYESLLPADVTVEQIKRIQEFHTDLAAAGAHAVGHLAIPQMKKHAALDTLTLDLPMVGKDTFHVEFDRKTQVPNRLADGTTDGTKEKFGSVSVKFTNYATGNRGALAVVKKMLSAEAAEKLGG